jgi:predicted nucleic acid-binding protein
VNGVVLDVSVVLAYASGESIEPGAMIALAGEDPDQHVWVPALCLGEATRRLVGTKEAALLDVLTGVDSDVEVSVYDGPTSRRVARIAAEQSLTLDAAHAIATALLYRCYLVTNDPDVAAAAGRLGLEALGVDDAWE